MLFALTCAFRIPILIGMERDSKGLAIVIRTTPIREQDRLLTVKLCECRELVGSIGKDVDMLENHSGNLVELVIP